MAQRARETYHDGRKNGPHALQSNAGKGRQYTQSVHRQFVYVRYIAHILLSPGFTVQR
jgi:hypothetical protein